MSDQPIRATVKIINRLGLHARPAMAFVDVANRFQSHITVRKDSETVDGKSIMQMMLLAATQGSELQLEAVGPDATQVIRELQQLIQRKFDEE
jgi:phosphocarrier protein